MGPAGCGVSKAAQSDADDPGPPHPSAFQHQQPASPDTAEPVQGKDDGAPLPPDLQNKKSLGEVLGLAPHSELRAYVDLLAHTRKVTRSSVPACSCAVSLEFLFSLAAKVPPTYTTADVTYRIIKPMTQKAECRFTDLMHAEHVAPPHYFISHRWGFLFRDLIALVRSALPGAVASRVFVWLDICAVNQHPGFTEEDLPNLENAICMSNGVLVIMDNRGLLLTRIWCLYEIWKTVTLRGHACLHFITRGFSTADVRDVYAALDVSRAEATVDSDRVQILADIEASIGLQAFNHTLKVLFLLNPLDARADADSILSGGLTTDGPAPTTSAAGPAPPPPCDPRVLGAFEEWLRLDASAPGFKALAVYGPPGCGKSFSAALLSRRPDVHAFHFVRASDQRNRDPMACVKSIAYQLAMRFPSLLAYYTSLSQEEALLALADVGKAAAILIRDAVDKIEHTQETDQRDQSEAVLGDGPGQAEPEQGRDAAVLGGHESQGQGHDVGTGAGAGAGEGADKAASDGEMAGIYPYVVEHAVHAAGQQAVQPAAVPRKAVRQKAVQQVVLLLDGLDEGGGAGAGDNAIVVLLREHLSVLPPDLHIRFVLFSRPDDHIKRVLTYSFKPTELHLDGSTLPPNVVASSCRVTDADAQQLGMPSGPDLLPVLLGRSSGSLVYMRVVLQLLAWRRQAEGLQPSGHAPAASLSPPWTRPDDLPEGLDGAFEAAMEHAVSQLSAEHNAKLQRLLDMLVVAQQPLTLRQLHQAGLGSEVEEVLQPALGCLLTIRDSQVTLFHQTLSDRLVAAPASSGEAGAAGHPDANPRRFRCSRADGHAALARACVEDLHRGLSEQPCGVGASDAPLMMSLARPPPPDGGGSGTAAVGGTEGGTGGGTGLFEAIREPLPYSLRYALLHLDAAAAVAGASAEAEEAACTSVGGDAGSAAAAVVAAATIAAAAAAATSDWAHAELSALCLDLAFWRRVHEAGFGAGVLRDLAQSHTFCAFRPAATAFTPSATPAAAAASAFVNPPSDPTATSTPAAIAPASSAPPRESPPSASATPAAAVAASAAVRAAVQWLSLHSALHSTHPDSIPQTAAAMPLDSPIRSSALAAPAGPPAWPAATRLNPPPGGSCLLSTTAAGEGAAYYTCVSVSRKAGVVVAGDHQGSLYMHRLWSGQKIMQVRPHARQVTAIAFFPEAELLVSLASDNTLNTTDSRTGQMMGTLFGHTAQVTCIAVAPDGLHLASASADGVLVIWDIAAQRQAMTFRLILPKPPSFQPPGMAQGPRPGFPGGGPQPRPGFPGGMQGPRPGFPAAPFGQQAPDETPSALAYAPASDLLAVGTSTGRLYLLVASSLQVTWKTDTSLTAGPGSPLTCLAFSPDGARLACGTHQYNGVPYCMTYSARNAERLGAVASPGRGDVRCLYFGFGSGSGGPAAAVTVQGSVLHVWSPARPDWRGRTLVGHLGPVQGAAFVEGAGGGDGQGGWGGQEPAVMAVSCAKDATIRTWDVPLAPTPQAEAPAEATQARANEGHTAIIQSLAASSDGSLLLSSGHDGTVRLWSATTGATAGVLSLPAAAMQLCAGGPPGRQVVAACTCDSYGQSQLYCYRLESDAQAAAESREGQRGDGASSGESVAGGQQEQGQQGQGQQGEGDETGRTAEGAAAPQLEMAPVGEACTGRLAALSVTHDGRSVVSLSREGLLSITAMDAQPPCSVADEGKDEGGGSAVQRRRQRWLAGAEAAGKVEVAAAALSPDGEWLAYVVASSGSDPEPVAEGSATATVTVHVVSVDVWDGAVDVGVVPVCEVEVPCLPGRERDLQLGLAAGGGEHGMRPSAAAGTKESVAAGGAAAGGRAPAEEERAAVLAAWERDGEARVWEVVASSAGGSGDLVDRREQGCGQASGRATLLRTFPRGVRHCVPICGTVARYRSSSSAGDAVSADGLGGTPTAAAVRRHRAGAAVCSGTGRVDVWDLLPGPHEPEGRGHPVGGRLLCTMYATQGFTQCAGHGASGAFVFVAPVGLVPQVYRFVEPF